MVAGKKNRHTSNQSKIQGFAGENGPRRLRSLSTGAERTQGRFQKWHKGTRAHTHVHTKCSLPGKRQSTRWKNMVTDALNPRTLKAYRDYSDRGRGNTPHDVQKGKTGRCGITHMQTQSDECDPVLTYETQLERACLWGICASTDSLIRTRAASLHVKTASVRSMKDSDLKQCRKRGTLLLIQNSYENKMRLENEPEHTPPQTPTDSASHSS